MEDRDSTPVIPRNTSDYTVIVGGTLSPLENWLYYEQGLADRGEQDNDENLTRWLREIIADIHNLELWNLTDPDGDTLLAMARALRADALIERAEEAEEDQIRADMENNALSTGMGG